MNLFSFARKIVSLQEDCLYDSNNEENIIPFHDAGAGRGIGAKHRDSIQSSGLLSPTRKSHRDGRRQPGWEGARDDA